MDDLEQLNRVSDRRVVDQNVVQNQSMIVAADELSAGSPARRRR